MSREDYLAEQRKFNDTYHIDFSVEDHQEDRRIESVFDDFVIDVDRENKSMKDYIDTLTTALDLFMENKTKMEIGKVYDMSDISIGSFVEDFDKVMQAKYESELKQGVRPTRKAFEGESFEKITKIALNSIRRYDKPLTGVWADNVVNKSLSIDQMRAFTDQAVSNLVGADPKNLGDKKKDLNNVFRARRTLEMVRKQRGFWWKVAPWHWRQNSREKSYLKSLNEKITEYSQRGFPMGEPEKTAVLNGVKNKLNNSIKDFNERQQKAREAIKDPIIEQNVNEAIKNPIVKPKANEVDKNPIIEQEIEKQVEVKREPHPNEQKAARLAADPAVKEKMVAQIANLIGESELGGIVKDFINKRMYDNLVEYTQNMWSALDEKNPAAIESKLAEESVNAFISAFTSLSNYKHLDPTGRLATAQKITDMMINQFSPVAFDKKYEKYGEGHYLNTCSLESIKGLVRNEDHVTARNILCDAKRALDTDKIHIDLSAHFVENGNEGEKSPRIDEPAAPNKDKVINK